MYIYYIRKESNELVCMPSKIAQVAIPLLSVSKPGMCQPNGAKFTCNWFLEFLLSRKVDKCVHVCVHPLGYSTL